MFGNSARGRLTNITAAEPIFLYPSMLRYILTSSINVVRKSAFLFCCCCDLVIGVGVAELLLGSCCCSAVCRYTVAFGLLHEISRSTTC